MWQFASLPKPLLYLEPFWQKVGFSDGSISSTASTIFCLYFTVSNVLVKSMKEKYSGWFLFLTLFRVIQRPVIYSCVPLRGLNPACSWPVLTSLFISPSSLEFILYNITRSSILLACETGAMVLYAYYAKWFSMPKIADASAIMRVSNSQQNSQ